MHPLDAAQLREDAARGRKDYLTNFFTALVLPDFLQRFPGARVENPRFLPTQNDGALLLYLLLPGGTMFKDRAARLSLDPASVFSYTYTLPTPGLTYYLRLASVLDSGVMIYSNVLTVPTVSDVVLSAAASADPAHSLLRQLLRRTLISGMVTL